MLNSVRQRRWGCSGLAEVPNNPHLIVPIGTQVVTRDEVSATGGSPTFPRGTVGELVKTPPDACHAYRVRFPDGSEVSLRRHEFSILKQVKTGPLGDPEKLLKEYDLYEFVVYRCIVGSEAHGLSREDSDIDRRGVYLPPADLHWSLYGVPEQLESPETEEVYWELQKFLVLALKANPNVLECLYTPLVETKTSLAEELLAMRDAFLSRLVYQTYNGYVMSQFKRLEQDWRAAGRIKWKHAMHLIRLLLSGITVLCEGFVPLNVSEHREQLLAIRRGEVPWDQVDEWRLDLHREFEQAYEHTCLPESPDYERVNQFLVRARRSMAV
jgi:predicted nucleotidyltransferase